MQRARERGPTRGRGERLTFLLNFRVAVSSGENLRSAAGYSTRLRMRSRGALICDYILINGARVRMLSLIRS